MVNSTQNKPAQNAADHLAYEAGQCNIGPAEIRKRQRIGYISGIVAILFIAFSEFFQFPYAWKFGLFAPLVYSLAGFLQARERFCFLFGFTGIFKTGDRRTRIDNDAFRNTDKRKSISLVIRIVLMAGIITCCYVALSR